MMMMMMMIPPMGGNIPYKNLKKWFKSINAHPETKNMVYRTGFWGCGLPLPSPAPPLKIRHSRALEPLFLRIGGSADQKGVKAVRICSDGLVGANTNNRV